MFRFLLFLTLITLCLTAKVENIETDVAIDKIDLDTAIDDSEKVDEEPVEDLEDELDVDSEKEEVEDSEKEDASPVGRSSTHKYCPCKCYYGKYKYKAIYYCKKYYYFCKLRRCKKYWHGYYYKGKCCCYKYYYKKCY